MSSNEDSSVNEPNPSNDSVEISEEAINAASAEEESTDDQAVSDDADQSDEVQEHEFEVTADVIRSLPDDEIMKLAEKAGQADHYRDVAARAQAEQENYRKRMERQRQDEARYAIVPFVREVLGSLDNLDRAIAAAKQSEEASALLQGVEMTRDLLIKSLAKFKVEAIDAAGVEFDPEVHDAVMMGADEEQPNNVILDCYETGWRLHERVIRPAKVRVNKIEG